MAKITFKLVTPERTVLSEEIDALTCPTTTGQITILPQHVPLVSQLAPGELIAKVNGQPRYIAVSGGFVEVRPGNQVIILADAAEHSEEIDAELAEQARARAEQSISAEKKIEPAEYARLAGILEHNTARLKVARRHTRQRRETLPDDQSPEVQ